MLDFRHFDVMTFDCYGTLIDWETGILGVLGALRGAHGLDATDDELLGCFSRAESHVQRSYYRPYREVLREVMKQIALHYHVSPGDYDEDALADSLAGWRPFDDTVQSLATLKQYFRLGIISNIDNDLFEQSHAHLGTEFDWTITAQDVGAYKPALRNFTYARDEIGVHPTRILHVAQSLFHDIRPAKTLDWQAVWVDRHRGSGGGATPGAAAEPDLAVPDLAALAAMVGDQLGPPVAKSQQAHFYI